MSVNFSLRIDVGTCFHLFEDMLTIDVGLATIGYIHCNYATEAQLNEFITCLKVVKEQRFPSVQTSEPIEEAKPEQASDASGMHGLPQDSDAPIQSYSNVGSEGLDAKWSDGQEKFATLVEFGQIGDDGFPPNEELDTTREVLKDDDIPF